MSVSDGYIKDVALGGEPVIKRISLPCSPFPLYNGTMDFGVVHTEFYDLSYESLVESMILIKANEDMTCTVDIPSYSWEKENGGWTYENGDTVVSMNTDGDCYNGRFSLSSGEVLVLRFSLAEQESGGVSAPDDAVADAVSLSHIGAEVSVSADNWSSLEYDGVKVSALEISSERLSFSVSSDEAEGRCLVFHIADSMGDMRVLMDGSPLKEGSYYDALFSSGDEGVWNASSDGSGTIVYVYVPHFSNHTVTIEKAESASAPQTSEGGPVIVPVLLAVMISAGALFAVVRRKKN